MTVAAADTLDGALALAQGLIRCKSVTPEEGGALTLLESVLRPAGFTCHRLTMTRAGHRPTCRTSTRGSARRRRTCALPAIPTSCRSARKTAWTRPPFGGVVDGGIVYGRGAADMKGGIACFVAATLDYLKANGGLKRGSLSFLITGDEEANAINGTVKVLEWIKARGETLDACVVGECTSSAAVGDEIKIGRRGSVTAELIVDGKQGHAAYPQLADNPDPQAGAHARPPVVDAARCRHAELPAVQPAGDRHLGAQHRLQRHPVDGAGAGQRALQQPALAPQDRGLDPRAIATASPREMDARYADRRSPATATCSSPSPVRWWRP